MPNSGYVIGTNQNLSRYTTDGIDFTFNYNQPIDKWGSLAFNFLGTWLNEYIVEPIPGLGSYDCAGLYGPNCNPGGGVAVMPEWKSKAMLVWNTPWNLNAALTWRYISSVDLTYSNSNPLLSSAYGSSDRTIGAQNYFDLALQWNATKNFTIRGGVNNIFDRDPPSVSSTANVGASLGSAVDPSTFGNGNTYPGLYDTLGRFLFVNVTAKF